MKIFSKKTIILAIVLAFAMAFIVPRDVKAIEEVPLTYEQTGTTKEKVGRLIVFSDYITGRKTIFDDALSRGIQGASGEGWNFETPSTDNLFVCDTTNGIYQYAKLTSFSKVEDDAGEKKGVVKYQIVSVTKNDLIDSVSFKVTPPEVGTTIDMSTEPTITVEDGANYKVAFGAFVNNLPSVDQNYDDGSIFGTEVEAGKDYFVEVFLEANENYEFLNSDAVACTVNGKTTGFETGYCTDEQFVVYAKVSVPEPNNTEESANTEKKIYEVTKGNGIRFNTVYDSNLEFTIDADYSLFENGGEVFVDNNKLDKKDYKSKSGSTIIALEDDYVQTLAAGEHELKVVFNDEGEAVAKFTITKSESPKAGDKVEKWIVLFIISVLGIIFIIKRNKK